MDWVGGFSLSFLSFFSVLLMILILTAYLVVGEEKHTGTQDPARGSSRQRLAAGVREWLYDWGCTFAWFFF